MFSPKPASAIGCARRTDPQSLLADAYRILTSDRSAGTPAPIPTHYRPLLRIPYWALAPKRQRTSHMADELILYTNPMSRGRIARWMLEEVGQPYKTEVLDYASGMKGPAYLAINPMGKVPALRHGDAVVTETAAICAYLADAFPQSGLAPPPGHRLRAPYYRWLFFTAGPFEAAVSNKALGFVVPPERERMIGYGNIASGVEDNRRRRVARPLSGRRQFHRRRSLCRLADRLRHDVRNDRKASGFRAILATAQQPSGLHSRQGA